MKLRKVKFINFRNYAKEEIVLSPQTNIFVGDNAVGKTSILEAIYALSLARSFKTKDKEMIKTSTDFLKISADTTYKDHEESLMLIASKDGKKVFVNSREIPKLSEFIGHINVVLFSPEDLMLLKNGPQEKRKLMDMSLLQLSRDYVEDFSNFKKQSKLRNDYLKYLLPKLQDNSKIEDEMLDILSIDFIKYNQRIYEARSKFVKDLEVITNTKYHQLSGTEEKITFEYLTNFENTTAFYMNRYRSDVIMGATQCGIHRDDIVFKKDGFDFETSASQGEMRMLTLSIKLALAEMIEKEKKEAPIVLLDDVFSELDKNHQNRLLSMLTSTMQILITTTDVAKIGKSVMSDAKIFNVTKGKVKEANYGRR